MRWREWRSECDVPCKTTHVGAVPAGSNARNRMTSTPKSPALRWAALVVLAAAWLPGAAQASALVAPSQTLFSAYSYARAESAVFNPNEEAGRFEKGNSCFCGTLNSYGNASDGSNNAYAAVAIASWQATDYPGGVLRERTAQARATGSYYDGVDNSVNGMAVFGDQTEVRGSVGIKGQVYLETVGAVDIASGVLSLEASHVGTKPNWMYEFLALTDLTFAFDYSYVLGGTPMPPELWIDGVSSLDPNLSAGTVLAHLSAGVVHKIELRNTLQLFAYVRPDYVAHADMDFGANWTLTETASNPDPNTVPEPGALSLALAGLGLAAAASRRQRG